MLFGRAPAKETVQLSELEGYVGKCFDAKLRRLSVRLPEIEAALSNSFNGFEKAVRGFSASSAAPDMDYLYRIKENFMESQKTNYSSSVIHLLSPPPKYAGGGVYTKAKDMLDSYSAFTTNVLKTNNSFKFVMVGYAKALADVKRNFTSLEKLCNELRNELATCAPEEDEYSKLIPRARSMQEISLGIAALRHPTDLHTSNSAESTTGPIHKQIEEKQKYLESARHRHREAESVLANLLLPVERAARKHDHLSPSKTQLSYYMKNPAENIRTAEDGKIIHQHLLKVVEEIREGKIEEKHPESLISQIDSIRSSDLLTLAGSSREAAAELAKAEAEMSELKIHMRALESADAERQKAVEGKAKAEKEIGIKQAQLLSEKKEMEQLILSCYKKNIEIVLP